MELAMAFDLSLAGYQSSPTVALLLPFLSLLFILKLIIIMRKKRISLNLPPGPTPLPILGHLHYIDRALPHRSLYRLSIKHGPIMQLRLGLKPTVVISSARMAGEIFKFHDEAFSDRPSLVSNRMLTYNFSDVAFSPHNGDEYRKKMKKLMVSNLLNTTTVRQLRSTREAEVWKMISSISTSNYTPSRPLNLWKIVDTLAKNIVFVSAFGRGVDGSDREKAEIDRITQQGANMLNRLFIEEFMPWLWWVDVAAGLYAKLNKAFRDLDDLYERIIQDHLDSTRPKLQDHHDYVGVLLRAMKESKLTRDHVKGIFMDVLFGATDTTAAVVAWGMAELVRNEGALKRCQEEIRRVVGKKGKVDEDDLTQLGYLKLVVKETMRLHPPASLIARECAQQCQVDGYDILPGTFVILNTWAIGRDPEAWDGPHAPDRFFPERFMNSSIDYKGRDFGILPFGSGRRGCPGIHFATPTIQLALANLLYAFDWELAADDDHQEISGETTADIAEMIALATLPKFNLYVPIKHHCAN